MGHSQPSIWLVQCGHGRRRTGLGRKTVVPAQLKEHAIPKAVSKWSIAFSIRLRNTVYRQGRGDNGRLGILRLHPGTARSLGMRLLRQHRAARRCTTIERGIPEIVLVPVGN